MTLLDFPQAHIPFMFIHPTVTIKIYWGKKFSNILWGFTQLRRNRTLSELRVRLAPLNRFKLSSKIFYWPFQGGTSFVDLLCFCSVLCLLCFVRVCLYVLCDHLLGKGWPLGSRLWCLLWVCHFPIGILGQVWYLIVSIPDLCNLITLNSIVSKLYVDKRSRVRWH